MAEFFANAPQNRYWPYHFWKKASSHERASNGHARHFGLNGATRALSTPRSQALPQGRNVDEELAAGVHPNSHRREYRVHLPPGYDPRVPVPMIMVLHGCHQTHLDIQKISQFDAIADREGAIVVYPWVTGYRGLRTINCWGWWMRNHRTPGRGEVEDLARIARAVTDRYAVDPAQRFICGLSSGACMSVVSLVAAGETWTAGASIAGVPYGEDARAIRISRFLAPRFKSRWQLLRNLQRVHGYHSPPPLLIVQSTADKVVTEANAEHLRDQWLSASGMPPSCDRQSSGTIRNHRWVLQGHHDEKGGLQTLFFSIEKLMHGWFGGEDGRYSTPDAPNLSELVWWFFRQHTPDTKPSGIKVVGTGVE